MLQSWITKYVGLRYGDKGRGPDEFDCWGLVRWVYMHEYGVILPDFMEYDSSVNKDQIEKVIKDNKDDSCWVRYDKAEVGDVVLFNIYGRPLHVGVAVGGNRFVHSPEGDFSRIEFYSARHWNKRVEGFYRHEAVSRRSEGTPAQVREGPVLVP